MRIPLDRKGVKYRIYAYWKLLNGSRTRKTWALFAVLVMLLTNVVGCERATKLTIEGTNPIKFVMTGNGSLRSIRLIGPDTQRKAPGEEGSVYWLIESNEPRSVDDIGTVAYGHVPEGYTQVYPESGMPPSLVEGVRYGVRISTANAPGAYQLFTMNGGKITVVYSK